MPLSVICLVLFRASVTLMISRFQTYRVEVAEVVDSDTVRVANTFPPDQIGTRLIRVNCIDTPEEFRPSQQCCDHERALANRAKAFAKTAIETAAAVFYDTGLVPGKHA